MNSIYNHIKKYWVWYAIATIVLIIVVLAYYQRKNVKKYPDAASMLKDMTSGQNSDTTKTVETATATVTDADKKPELVFGPMNNEPIDAPVVSDFGGQFIENDRGDAMPLKMGAKGPNVERFQRFLNVRGQNKGITIPITGIWDNATEMAAQKLINRGNVSEDYWKKTNMEKYPSSLKFN